MDKLIQDSTLIRTLNFYSNLENRILLSNNKSRELVTVRYFFYGLTKLMIAQLKEKPEDIKAETKLRFSNNFKLELKRKVQKFKTENLKGDDLKEFIYYKDLLLDVLTQDNVLNFSLYKNIKEDLKIREANYPVHKKNDGGYGKAVVKCIGVCRWLFQDVKLGVSRLVLLNLLDEYVEGVAALQRIEYKSSKEIEYYFDNFKSDMTRLIVGRYFYG